MHIQDFMIFGLFLLGAIYTIATTPRLKEAVIFLLVITLIAYVINQWVGTIVGLIVIVIIAKWVIQNW